MAQWYSARLETKGLPLWSHYCCIMFIMIWIQGYYQQFEHSGSVVERLTRDQGVASLESLLLHNVYHDLGSRLLSAVGAQWLSGRALDSRPRGCLYGVTAAALCLS